MLNMNENSIITCTICQDEMQILPYTLPQSLKFSDKVIVINGGTKLSTDGTTEYLNKLYLDINDYKIKENENLKDENGNLLYEIINNYGSVSETKYSSYEDVYKRFEPPYDLDNKLILKHGIFGDNSPCNNWDKIQRMQYINILNDLEFEGFSFLNDADETQTDKHWELIIKAVKYCNDTDKILIRFPYVNFFYDTSHVVEDKNFSTLSHHLCKFEPFNRQYIDNSTLLRDCTLPDIFNPKILGRCLTHYPKDMILETDKIKLYHYSHIRSYEEEKYRTWKYLKRGDKGAEIASTIPDDVNKWMWTDPRKEELKDTNRVKQFLGSHPSHMQKYIENYNK